MKNLFLNGIVFFLVTLLLLYGRPGVAQTSDTCYLKTEKYYWMDELFPDTLFFEEAMYDSVLCCYKVVAIDTNPGNYNEDSKKFNLIHITDKSGQYMFTIVTFCEDTIDCGLPLQIGAWYDLLLRSVGDNDLFWRTNYLDRTFEFSINGKKILIGSRMLKFRVVITDSIKDLFYVGST